MKFFSKFSMSLCLLLFVQSARSETHYLLPDSYQLNTGSEQNAVKITQTRDGYQAILSFKPRYESARNFLKSQYGDDYSNLNIVELPVNTQGFRYLHESTLGSLILKKIDSYYFGPELRVNLDFSSELTKEQLQQLISFNLVYGMVDATIACSGTTFHSLCDQPLPTLSAFNQYQLNAMDPTRSKLAEDYLILTEYRNRLGMEQRLPSGSKAVIDALAIGDLFTDDGDCRTTNNSYRMGVCQAIITLSPVKRSLIDAITSLARKIFPQELDDIALRNIIVNPNLLGINEVIFPLEESSQTYGASIGNHESVNVRLYRTLNDGPIIEVKRNGFTARHTKKFVYKVNRRMIVYEEGAADELETTSFGPEDIRFSEHLKQIRDFVAFISAPDRFTWGNAYDASILVPSLRTLIAYMDTQITKTGLLVPNCVLYDHPTSVFQGSSWNMTGGPLGELGPWNDRATFAWVRTGYQLITLPLANFDKQDGWEIFSPHRGDGVSMAEGALFDLSGTSSYRSISSAICIPKL